MVERYKRANKDHPNRKIVETWKPARRLQQQSVLDVTSKLQEKHHLPENREQEEPVPKQLPPHLPISKPIIHPELITEMSKKDTCPLDLKATAERTIHSYPEDCIKIYTDGSAFKEPPMQVMEYGLSIQTTDVMNLTIHVGLIAQTMRLRQLLLMQPSIT